MKKVKEEERKAEVNSKRAEKDALKYCNGKRVNVTQDSRQLDALKKEYEKQEKEFLSSIDGQSYDDIRQRKCKKRRQVDALETFINCQDRNLEHVTNMVEKRKKFFITMRSTAMRSISRDFTKQMDLHNLEGKLTPHYKMAMLDVDVRPKKVSAEDRAGHLLNEATHHKEDSGIQQDMDGANTHRSYSLASLSGGERSKTLVCLINSLWSVQQPPLRCLDEWDVYLDALARKQMEAMLVQTALNTNHQYFFISPQGSMFADIQNDDWSDFKYSEKLKVFTVKK